MVLRTTIREQDYNYSVIAGTLIGIGATAAAYTYVVQPLLPLDDAIYPGIMLRYLCSNWSDPVPSVGGWDWKLTLATVPSGLMVAGVLSLKQGSSRPLITWGCGFLAGTALGTTLLTSVAGLGFATRLLAVPGLALGGGLFGLMLLSPPPERLIRGTRIAPMRPPSARALRRVVQKGQLVFVGVVLSAEGEKRHVLVVGATGTGKSTAILLLLGMTLARGDRHVVVDPNGLAMDRFWKPGDVILNPFDPRSAAWDLLAEIRDPGDAARLAETLIPASTGQDQSWVQFARTVLGCCLERWHQVGGGSSKQFFEAMAQADAQVLGALCQGTAAESCFAPSNARMLGSIMVTVNQALAPMAALGRVSGPSFSVRDWVRGGTGTLWLPYRPDQIATLRTLISSWMSLAITETLSLTQSDTRRLWFHLDELDALGPIQGLRDAVTRLRKFGGRVVMGVQSISQVRATYGAADANTIVENCETKLILRSAKGDRDGTAAFASALIGEHEIERDQVTTSSSDGQHRSGSVSIGRQRIREPVVLDSEIMQLPDRTGYLKILGKPEWMKVSF